MNSNFSYNIHESYMERALELAKEGIGSVSPNPLVGCILVKNGEIIGEGFHEEFGGDHAEVSAFNNSHKDPLDATAYINLEPCCIESKTLSCTKLLFENGIKEVFIAMIDPNPKISGNGVKELELYGIKVNIGINSNKIKNFYKSYFLHKKKTSYHPRKCVLVNRLNSTSFFLAKSHTMCKSQKGANRLNLTSFFLPNPPRCTNPQRVSAILFARALPRSVSIRSKPTPTKARGQMG